MDIKQLVDDLGKDWKQFREDNDKRLDALEKNQGVAEIEEKLEKIDSSIDEMVKAKQKAEEEAKLSAERIDQLEASLDSLGSPSNPDRKDLKEYEDVFDQYMRSFATFGGGKQADPEITRKLNQLAKSIPEYKDIQTTTGAAGGVAVPEVISRDIADQTRLLSPLRQLCKVVPVGTSDYKELVNIHGENSAWVGETGARSQTLTPQFRERAPTMGTLYAYPRATEESMDDVFFNVAAMLTDVSATEFSIAEATAFLSGNGTNRPTGMLNTAPTTDTDDASPARSAEAFEYVPLDTSSPTNAIDPDQLITLVYRLRAPYRLAASWIMNSVVTGEVRKLKDGQSQYLWAPGLQPGEPARLLGFPHVTIEAMDDVSAVNNHPIMFGNFRRGYLVVDRVGLRITVDDNITTPGYINWYIRKRVGGIILDNNAVKVGKYASS